MTPDWEYFILGVIAYQILKMLFLGFEQAIIDHRKKRFLNLVNVIFPDRAGLTFISIDTSDKRSMDKLERQFREQFEISEEQDSSSDRGRSGEAR